MTQVLAVLLPPAVLAVVDEEPEDSDDDPDAVATVGEHCHDRNERALTFRWRLKLCSRSSAKRAL